MIKGNDVIGKPVLKIDKQIETIQDIIFDPDTKRILGFIVDEGGWFKDTRILLWEGVEQIDDNGVTLLSEKYLIPAGYAPPIQDIVTQGNLLRQTKAITTDGNELGLLVDVYFDKTTGEVEAFDVLGAEADRLTDKPLFVPMSMVRAVSQTTVVVKATVADVLDWGGA